MINLDEFLHGKKEPCICEKKLEKGGTLFYTTLFGDGMITYTPIGNIQYCPICGKGLMTDEEKRKKYSN